MRPPAAARVALTWLIVPVSVIVALPLPVTLPAVTPPATTVERLSVPLRTSRVTVKTSVAGLASTSAIDIPVTLVAPLSSARVSEPTIVLTGASLTAVIVWLSTTVPDE